VYKEGAAVNVNVPLTTVFATLYSVMVIEPLKAGI
jgi:hypothetical protein